MRFSDVLILYCAAGASFAAHRFVQRGDRARRPAYAAAGFVVDLALWLFVLASEVWRSGLRRDALWRVGSRAGAAANSSRASVADERRGALVRDAYEQARAALFAAQGEAECRSATCSAQAALERYAQLALWSRAEESSAVDPARLSDTRATALQKLAGRAEDDLACAAACLARRDRRVLARHVSRARRDLVRACASLGGAATLPLFLDRARELAELLGDDETAAALADIARPEPARESRAALPDESAGGAPTHTPSRIEHRTPRHAGVGSSI